MKFKKILLTIALTITLIPIGAFASSSLTTGNTVLHYDGTGDSYVYVCDLVDTSAICSSTDVENTFLNINILPAGQYRVFGWYTSTVKSYNWFNSNIVPTNPITVYSNGSIFSFSEFPPPPPPVVGATGPSLSDLTGAVGSGYNAIIPTASPFAYLFIGAMLVFLVIGFAVKLFKKKDKKTGEPWYERRADGTGFWYTPRK